MLLQVTGVGRLAFWHLFHSFWQLPLPTTKHRCCTSACMHLLSAVIYNPTKYRYIYLQVFFHNLLPPPPPLGGIITSKIIMVFMNTNAYIIYLKKSIDQSKLTTYLFITTGFSLLQGNKSVIIVHLYCACATSKSHR